MGSVQGEEFCTVLLPLAVVVVQAQGQRLVDLDVPGGGLGVLEMDEVSWGQLVGDVVLFAVGGGEEGNCVCWVGVCSSSLCVFVFTLSVAPPTTQSLVAAHPPSTH